MAIYTPGNGNDTSGITLLESPNSTIAITDPSGPTTSIDLAQDGGTTSSVLQWNGTKWAPTANPEVTSLGIGTAASGSSGQLTATVISAPSSTNLVLEADDEDTVTVNGFNFDINTSEVTLKNPAAFATGMKYLIINASTGLVAISSLGPAS